MGSEGEQALTGVLIVSDIRLYREGLVEILARDGRLRVVGQAANRDRAVELAKKLRPEAVLLDMAMPESRFLVAILASGEPAAKVIALGISEKKEDIVACAEAGIVGYVCRGNSIEELVQAVESAVEGELRCSAGVAAALMRRVAALAAGRSFGRQRVHLTHREMEVVRLMNEGLSNRQIASQLNIQLSTAKNHVHNILDKLGVHRRSEATARLRRGGLLLEQRAL